LVALAPDVILAPGSAMTGALLQSTRTIPIVFATIPDPMGASFVESLAQCHGLQHVRIRPERVMAGTAQANLATL